MVSSGPIVGGVFSLTSELTDRYSGRGQQHLGDVRSVVTERLTRLQRGSRESPGRRGATRKCFPHTVRESPAQAIAVRFQVEVSTESASRILRCSELGRSTSSMRRPASRRWSRMLASSASALRGVMT